MEPKEWDRGSEEYLEALKMACALNHIDIDRALDPERALQKLCDIHHLNRHARYVLIVQDESNFAVRELVRAGYQYKSTGLGVKVPGKESGKSVMNSDFISEEKGCVSLP